MAADFSNTLLSNLGDRAWLDHHVSEFEQWFIAQQRAHGMEGTPLIQVEHAILRAYITWLKRRTYADDQAQREM